MVAIEHPLLKPRETADLLGISPRTLYSLSSPRGPIPVVRLGKRSIRYSRDALASFIEAQQSIVENQGPSQN